MKNPKNGIGNRVGPYIIASWIYSKLLFAYLFWGVRKVPGRFVYRVAVYFDLRAKSRSFKLVCMMQVYMLL